jgi:hypothetical protein
LAKAVGQAVYAELALARQSAVARRPHLFPMCEVPDSALPFRHTVLQAPFSIDSQYSWAIHESRVKAAAGNTINYH